MQRDARASLWDALRAADLLNEFGTGRDFTDYQADAMLRSAVERQLEVLGAALNQLSSADARIAVQIPELDRIVAFRNILVHGYATVDDALVWQVLAERIPDLVGALRSLLKT